MKRNVKVENQRSIKGPTSHIYFDNKKNIKNSLGNSTTNVLPFQQKKRTFCVNRKNAEYWPYNKGRMCWRIYSISFHSLSWSKNCDIFTIVLSGHVSGLFHHLIGIKIEPINIVQFYWFSCSICGFRKSVINRTLHFCFLPFVVKLDFSISVFNISKQCHYL